MYEPQEHSSNGTARPPQLGTPPAQQNDEDVIDLRAVIVVLRRRWWLILALLVLGVLLAFLHDATATRVYEATTSVLVDTSSSGSSISQLALMSGLTGGTSGDSIQTQTEIMKSKPIVQAALKRLPPADALTVRSDDIQVLPLRNTSIVEITVPSTKPEISAAMANAMAQRYIDQTEESSRTAIEDALVYLSKQLATSKPELERARLELMVFKERNLTVDLPSESAALIGREAQLETARQTQMAVLASARRELKARSAAHIPLPGGADGDRSRVVGGPGIAAVKTRLADLMAQRRDALAEYVPASPEVRRIDAQIRATMSLLSEEAATELTQDIAPLQIKVWVAEANQQAILAARDETRSQLRQQPALEYQLAGLMSNVLTSQKTYDMLNEQFQTLRISEQAQHTQTRIVVSATAPDVPVLPRTHINMLLGLVLGLLAGIGVAMVAERLDDRVHSQEEAVAAAGVPVLGMVRRYRADTSPQLTGDEKYSDLLEAFRALRSNITLSEADRRVRVVAVCSSRPSEGKTSTAINLATVLALDGKRTVLVDGDLRAPSVQERLKCASDVGLTQIALGHVSIADALQSTATPNLQVITAGPIPPNPAELLNSASWHRSMDELRNTMDYVIVDTPPITMFTDAQILASMADATILVVSASQTNATHLQQSRNLLDLVGARLLGLVMNKADTGLGGSGYQNSRYAGDYAAKP